MNKGLLVTELLGHGVNLVTGDYSQGAAGFWVENGEITHPVEEITIAGNLKICCPASSLSVMMSSYAAHASAVHY